MNKFSNIILTISSTLLLFAGCSKDITELVPEEPVQKDMVKLTVLAETPGAVWLGDETAAFYVNGYTKGAISVDLSDKDHAKFHIPGVLTSTKSIQSVCPVQVEEVSALNVLNSETDAYIALSARLPQEQHPTSESFDGQCDILMANQPLTIEPGSKETDQVLTYVRPMAITKIDLKGVRDAYVDDHVMSVQLTVNAATPKYLAGDFKYNVDNWEFVDGKGIKPVKTPETNPFLKNASNSIKFIYDQPQKLGKEFAIWMVSAPVLFDEGDEIVLEIVTDKNILSSHTLMAESLQLDASKSNTISIDMNNVFNGPATILAENVSDVSAIGMTGAQLKFEVKNSIKGVQVECDGTVVTEASVEDGFVRYNVSGNQETIARAGQIRLILDDPLVKLVKTVTVSQLGLPFFEISDIDNLSHEGVSGATADYVLNNSSNTVTATCDGVVVTSAKAENGILTYTVSSNLSSEKRVGRITLTLDNYDLEISKEINVNQNGKPLDVENSLLLPASGEEIVLTYGKAESGTVEFSWTKEGFADSESYSLCLSLNENMDNMASAPIVKGADGRYTMTYDELENLLIQLYDRKYYAANLIYWNIRTSGGGMVAKTSASLKMTEMMILKDVRGSEVNIYKIVRLNYNGKSVLWTAENLRTKKYNDGTDIDPKFAVYMNEGVDLDSKAKMNLPEKQNRAYGVFYQNKIDKARLAPKGWKVPSLEDCQELFNAAKAAGGHHLLKDPEYYPSASGVADANAWGFGLCAAGEWKGWSGALPAFGNYGVQFSYFLVTNDQQRTALYDGGDTLWHVWNFGAPARLILTE